jgi:S1-C subfamily serine protease
VNISVQARTLDAFGLPVLREGTGTGFIVDKHGHVVTNEHVVAGADRLDIILADGSIHIGDVIAEDPAVDLAVVQIEAPDDKLAELTVASLGDSDALRVGEWVVAIGSPFGLEQSASVGIVSSVGRSRPGIAQRLITDMIQTDAAINPGNSGGPLLNMRGQVIGINEQIEAPARGNVGVGFAIPVDTLRRFLPDLVAGRQPEHAWFGAGGVTLTPTLAEQLGLENRPGVVLSVVAPGSPADQAGLRGAQRSSPADADIVTALDDRSIRSFEDLADYVNERRPGDTVRVTYVRAGEVRSAELRLGVWEPHDFPGR